MAVTASVSEGGARFSPDSHWLAYHSDETGRNEVYVVSFPENGSKRQISQGGGYLPLWSPAGDELYFRQGNSFMVVPVSMTADQFHAEPARLLFEFTESTGNLSVAPDGQRFLATVRNPDSAAREIHIVQNWFEVLKEKAGR